jgi:hypothetical protein
MSYVACKYVENGSLIISENNVETIGAWISFGSTIKVELDKT